MEERRYIALVPGEAPVVRGTWTVGEVRQALGAAMAWLDRVPLKGIGEEAMERKSESANEEPGPGREDGKDADLCG